MTDTSYTKYQVSTQPGEVQTRHVPLNEEAVNTLRRWREQSGPGARVFAVATGFKGA